MPRFLSDRERRLWIAVAVAVAILLAALYPLQLLLDTLRERNLLRLTIAALFLACGAAVITHLARRAAGFFTWLVLALAGVVYAALALAMEVPQERLHLVEYGALALLVRAAVGESASLRALGRRVTNVDIWVLGLVTLIGWLDEAVQGALPNRQYDLRDVAFNALAAALALGAAATVRWSLGPTSGDRGMRDTK